MPSLKQALVIQPGEPGTHSTKLLFFGGSSVVGSAEGGAITMVYRDLNTLKIGTLVKLKGGPRVWEFRGLENGKIVLSLPASTVSILVNEEQVDWKSIQRKP